jgi:hypothetical protein
MKPDAFQALGRRGFLKAAGALVIGFSLTPQEGLSQFGGAPIPGSPDNRQLDSWLAITADGWVIAYTGKEEDCHGTAAACSRRAMRAV